MAEKSTMVKKSRRFLVISIVSLIVVLSIVGFIIAAPSAKYQAVQFGHGADEVFVSYQDIQPQPTLDFVVSDFNERLAKLNPAPVDYSGQACTSLPNSCLMTNKGTTRADGTCNAVAPLDSACVVDNSGQDCTSSENRCGMSNSGKTIADGSCNAVAPLDSACPIEISGETVTSGDKKYCQNPGSFTVVSPLTLTRDNRGSYSKVMTYSAGYSSWVAGSQDVGAPGAGVPGPFYGFTSGKDMAVAYLHDYGYVVVYCRYGCTSSWDGFWSVTLRCS